MLGGKIKCKRIEKGMSLRSLADKSQLTPSFLSQVERGLSAPSVGSLRRISEALEVPMFYFFLSWNGNGPVVREEQCIDMTLPMSPAVCKILTPDSRRKMGVVKMSLAPGHTTSPGLVRCSGEHCAHVLQGKMRVVLGDEVYELNPGDSIYYYASIPHRMISIGQEDLVCILAVTPPHF